MHESRVILVCVQNIIQHQQTEQRSLKKTNLYQGDFEVFLLLKFQYREWKREVEVVEVGGGEEENVGGAINIETEKEFPTAGTTCGLVHPETVDLSNVTNAKKLCSDR